MVDTVPLEKGADSPWWSLDFTIAWIATREQSLTERVCRDLDVRGIAAVQQPTARTIVSLQQAMAQLWFKLQANEISAQGVLTGPTRVEEGPRIGIRRITITRNVERLKIKAAEWIDLRWMAGKSTVSAFGMKAYSDVCLPRQLVESLWPSVNQQPVLNGEPEIGALARPGPPPVKKEAAKQAMRLMPVEELCAYKLEALAELLKVGKTIASEARREVLSEIRSS